MTKEEAIKWFKTRTALAEQLGISATNIPKWDKIPPWHQKAIERITNGELKADVISANDRPKLKRVSYYLPQENYKMFKQLCKKQNVSMKSKLNELIENELIT